MRFCGGCGARLAAASVEGGRERKVVTVLFCDLVGFTAASDGADPEEVQASLSPYHARARLEIERFGGTVEKFIGDAVMAAFGAPVVHEDDPERAVRAGLGLLAAVEDLNRERGLGLAVRIGIATGEAVVSTGARPERGEGMLAGDVVNTAARLQTAAPVGAVLVGRATRDAAVAQVEFEAVDPVLVKGKSEPLAVWVAVRPRGSTGEALADTSWPMVGRSDELVALQSAYSRAVRESSVQLVTVVAEPGLGKSRLVQAFGDWVDERDELVTWRQGRCPAYGDAMTFAALGSIVKAQASILDSDSAVVAESKLTETVRALLAGTDLVAQESWLVARLSPLVGLAAQESPQEELFTAWRRFLEVLAASGPLVLVIEDLHWADKALLEFLTHLLDWVVGVPLVIIATARPELFDTAAMWGAGHRNSNTLTLAPLSAAETSQLVTVLLGTQVLPADLHAALLARAAGNPLYTREYLNLLTARSDAVPASNSPEAVAELAAALPGSVQAVIAARLDTLPTQAKQLLQAAAVVGHSFWAGAVAHLTGTDPQVVASTLHDLIRRDYLRPVRVSSIAAQSEYTFNHALIADVAYQQLPRSIRAQHHHHTADWHVALAPVSGDTGGGAGVRGHEKPGASGGRAASGLPGPAGAQSGQAAVVAHHYTQAHRLTKTAGGDPFAVAELAASAARWHIRAGQQMEPLNLATAERHTLEALDLMPSDHPDRPALLLFHGDIQENAGRVSEAEHTYQLARQLSEDLGDLAAAAVADVHRSRVLQLLARADEALALMERAVTVLEQHPPGPGLLDAYVQSGMRHWYHGWATRALGRVEQALTLAEELEDPPARMVVNALVTRASCRALTGEPGGEADLSLALDLAGDDTRLLIVVNEELAFLKTLTHSAHDAIPFDQRALALATQRGYTTSILLVTANLAETQAVSGRIDDAIAACEAAARVALSTDSPRDVLALYLYWSWVLTIRGDFEHATALLNEALPTARGVEPNALVDLLLLSITCAEQLAAQAPKGMTIPELTAELVDTLTDSEADVDLARFLPRLARRLCHVDQLELMVRIMEHTPAGVLLYDNNLLTVRATIAETRGEHAEAIALYLQAHSAWTDYGYPLEEAHALLGAVRCHHALHQPAGELLQRAHHILTGLDARPLLAEVELLLRADQAIAGIN